MLSMQPVYNLKNSETLKSEKIFLRLFTSSDARQLSRAFDASRDELEKAFKWVSKIKDTKTLMDTLYNILEDRSSFLFGVFSNNPRQLIGLIGLYNLSTNKSAEVKFWIITSKSGHGYATEACTLIQKYCFENLKLHRIYLNIACDNPASIRVAEKCNFLKEGVLRDAIFTDDEKFSDVILYSRIASDTIK